MRWFAWPGFGHLAYAMGLSVAFTAWFALCYGGASLVTGLHDLRVPIHLPFEPRLPLVAPMLAVYMSIYALFALEPFVLRSRDALRWLVRAQALAVAIGAACFVLLPSVTAYPPPELAGVWAKLYATADRWNLDYNNVPSLHVALSVITVAVLSGNAPRVAAAGLWAWAALMSAATVLTHQHHLVDVPTGWLLAWLVLRSMQPRGLARSPAPSAPGSS